MNRRRKYLIDAGLQLPLVGSMVMTCAILTLAYLVGIQVSSVHDVGPDSVALRWFGALITGAYFAVVLIATLVTGIRATNRVAGPARLIESAVRGLRRREYDHRLTLRERDCLKSLAHEVAALRDEIQADERARGELLELLVDAIDAGDRVAARNLARCALTRAGASGESGPDGSERPVTAGTSDASEDESSKPIAAAGVVGDAGRRGGTERGVSLIDTLMGLVVGTVAAFGLVTALAGGQRLQRNTAAYGSASRAIAEVHATLHNGDLDASVVAFKADPTIEIDSIDVEVRFPVSLLTDLLGGSPVPSGWRYRDLDGDGQVERDPAATGAAGLLPVTVVASWRGGSATSSFLVGDR